MEIFFPRYLRRKKKKERREWTQMKKDFYANEVESDIQIDQLRTIDCEEDIFA